MTLTDASFNVEEIFPLNHATSPLVDTVVQLDQAAMTGLYAISACSDVCVPKFRLVNTDNSAYTGDKIVINPTNNNL